MRAGTPVSTPLGAGRVNYIRMAPPDYRAPGAVSVLLDAKVKAGHPGYAGSIFLVEEIRTVTEAEYERLLKIEKRRDK
jgi:hypothetical protein